MTREKKKILLILKILRKSYFRKLSTNLKIKRCIEQYPQVAHVIYFCVGEQVGFLLRLSVFILPIAVNRRRVFGFYAKLQFVCLIYRSG
jgi:hypothetical protein